MISGTAEVVGSASLIKKLEEVGEGADNLGDVWPKIGQLFAKRQSDIFAKGGRPRWKPLKPRYILQRRRDGLGGRTLVRTGALKRAATDPKPAKASPKYAVFGPAGRTAPHWVLHKHGTKRMPKRDPLPNFTKAERVQVRELIAKHVVKPWES